MHASPLSRSVAAVAAAVVAVLAPFAAAAGPFSGADPFIGKGLVPDTGEEGFFAGAHLQFAPVDAIIHSVVKAKTADYTKQHPEAAPLVRYAGYVDPAQTKKMADAGQVDAYKAALRAEMKARGETPTPAQDVAIQAIDAEQLKKIAELSKILSNREPTTTFALEPYAGWRFGRLMATAQVPIAGFHTSTKDAMVLGNPGVDVRMGTQLGGTMRALGVAVGVSGWAPLGSDDADTIVLSNVLASPRYLHRYGSWTGYAAVGGELGVVDIVARGEYVEMRPSADKGAGTAPADNRILRYVNAGALATADFGLVGVQVAADGLFNVSHLPSYHNTWLITAGLRVFLRKIRIGLGVQVPLARPGQADAVPVGGVNLGAPAAYNVLANAQLRL